MMLPIHQRAESSSYGQPKHGSLTEIVITRPVSAPFIIPTSEDALEELLSNLPNGFSKDYRFGVGLLWENRFILEAIADIDGISTLVIHGGDGAGDAKITGGTYYLGIQRYHDMRQCLRRLTQRHQRETRSDKQLACFSRLAHAADPLRFPEKAKSLRPDIFADLVNDRQGKVVLSRGDLRTATRLVRDNVMAIAMKEPEVLLNLKADIELVTLGELIERYKKLLASNALEARWQAFLADNPFILNMAFAYPVKVICDRPYVGSKRFNGKGGNYSDFLVAARSTGNVALIEIKHPGVDLLTPRPYRNDTYGPSGELSGSVAQVIAQRVSLQREILQLKEDLEDEVHAHAVATIAIVGRTPEGKAKKRSFEQYRNSLRDVSVVTFDELQQRLEDVFRALSPAAHNHLMQNAEDSSDGKKDDLPF
ncbi:Shedu immune nuclease family protein [Pseudomonas yamanorum]